MESNKKLLAPRFLLPMGAVLVLLSGYLFYYFLIISRQEASLDDRAFRSLAAVSGQLRDLVSNYAEVMQRSTTEKFTQGNFRAFVAEQVPDLKIDERCPASGPPIRPTLGDDGDGLEFVTSKACAHVLVGTVAAPLLAGPSREIFDEVLLTTSKGRVLYQTQTAGAVANDLAPFLQGMQGRAKNAGGEKEASNSPAFTAASQSSNLATISLGGNTYRAYLVPVPLTANEVGDAPDKLVLGLCGLIRQERFRAAGRSVPGTALTTLVLAVVLVIVGTWPLLKFSQMRLTERIPRNAGLYYALSSTATIVMMTVLVIDIRYVFYDPETDENLKKLAATIDGNLGQELGQALRVMNSIAGSSLYSNKGFQDHTKLLEPGCSRKQDTPPANAQTDLLTLTGMQLTEYPYFRRFFGYDRYGFEQLKWTVDSAEPPSLRVCDRPYFIGTMRNQLWHLKDDISGPHFRVDPIYSKLSGEYLAVIAEPTSDPEPGPQTPRVLTMVTPLLSLIRPVLPPDYGFAVIDESGKVLFHSEAAKNGHENFFDETSDASELRGAVTARRPALRSINYSGFRHRVFVAPLASVEHSPWYLITFSNLSTARADLVDQLVLFSALVLIYFALIIVPCALALMLLRPNRVLWIWPTPDRRGSYHHLILTFIVVLPLFYALVFRSNAWQLLAFAVLVPVLSALFAFFKLTSRDKWIRWTALALPVAGLMTFLKLQGTGRNFYLSFLLICAAYFFLSLKSVTERLHRWERWSFLTGFSVGSFCLVVIAAAVPSIALFKAAYDYEENMATRREQLLTMQSLEAREERVIQQYLNVKVSVQQTGYADDIAKWLFLRRRLEEQKLDVYDRVFQDQQSAQIFKPGGPLEHEQPPRLLSWLAERLPFSSGSFTNNLSRNSAEDSQWEWDNEGTNRIRIHPVYDQKIKSHEGSPQTLALAKRFFRDPVFLTQELAYDLEVLQPWPFFIAVVPVLLFLLGGMYYSVRSTLQKMFLIGMELPAALPEISLHEAVSRQGNFILLGLPCSEKTRMLESEPGISVVDIALFPQGKLDVPDATSAAVVFDHFEFDMDDDAANLKKLDLLEQLVHKKQKVLIVTTIDPLFYLESIANGLGDTSASCQERSRTLQRWGRVLANFAKCRLKSQATCSNACYRLLWSTCTRNERAALYGLAHDGWANYKNNAALEHLWERGLIQRSPMFQLAGEYAGFGKFISGAVTREERNRWDVRHVPGVFDWDGLKAMLLVLLTGTVAVVLFFNQQEVLGYITGAISTVLPLAKMVTDMRGSRGSPTAKSEGASA